MVDIGEQISYWQNGASEDIEAAKQLINGNKVRHGLFFAHLALEKALKANICKHTQKIAPKIHSLVRLAEIAGLNPSEDIVDFLADMSEFNLDGRYPVPFLPSIPVGEAKEYIKKTQETLEWFRQQL